MDTYSWKVTRKNNLNSEEEDIALHLIDASTSILISINTQLSIVVMR